MNWFRKSENLPLLDPTLAEVLSTHGLDPAKTLVALVSGAKKGISPREDVPLSDGTKSAIWRVPFLRALFRGDKVPPSFGTGEPPAEYLPCFHFVERHVVTFCHQYGAKTDGEFEEAYSNLRRRPDGKPISDLHSFLWQVGALLAGRQPTSAAEFDAVFGRLARSASIFRIGLVSRNYIETLEGTV